MPAAGQNRGVLRGGIEQFLRRRARRILPAFYFAMAVSLVVGIWVTHTLDPLIWATPDFWGPLMLVNDVWGSAHSYDGPLWSLPIEWHCYFTLPIVAFLWARCGAQTALAAALAGCCGFLALTNHFGLAWVQPQFYMLFYLGGLAAWITSAPGDTAQTFRRLPWQLGVGGCRLYGAFFLAQGWRQYVADPLYFELLWAA